MQSMVVDLGSVQLESTLFGLQLQLSSTAKFDASAEDDIATLRERLTLEQLNADRVDQPWITRGDAFRLELSLRIEANHEAGSREVLSETLTMRLRTAKLWSQLDLVATSVEASVFPSGNHLFTVFLTHCEGAAERGKCQIHRLGVNTAFYDMQPPCGVSEIPLECVRLDLRIRKNDTRKRSKLKKQCKDSKLHEYSSEDRTISAFVPERGKLLPKTYDDTLTNGNQSMIPSTSCDTSEDSMRGIATIPGLLKRTSSSSNLDLDEEILSTESALEMVDAGIRVAISGCCRRGSAQGITLTETHSFKALEDLAPSIWSSGYLRAISSRALFVPTISHAIGSICNQSSKWRTLRAREDLSASVNALVEAQSESSVVSTSLSLFQTLRKGIHDPAANRRLQPLSFSTDTTYASPELHEDILESSQETSYRSDSGDEEGVDDSVLLESDTEEHYEIDEDLFDDDCSSDTLAEAYRELTPNRHILFASQSSTSRSKPMDQDSTSPVTQCDIASSQSIWHEEELEDDLLSICESFKSLPLVNEGCHGEHDGDEGDVKALGGHEMLWI